MDNLNLTFKTYQKIDLFPSRFPFSKSACLRSKCPHFYGFDKKFLVDYNKDAIVRWRDEHTNHTRKNKKPLGTGVVRRNAGHTRP